MTRNAVNGVQAGLVLLASVACWAFIPHQVLRPVALCLLVLGVSGVFAARFYLRRLHEVVGFLESNRLSFGPHTLTALLTEIEMKVLGLEDAQDAGHAIGAVRDRLPLITQAGLFLGIVGISAGLIAIMAYAD